jgi:hypothetical protein
VLARQRGKVCACKLLHTQRSPNDGKPRYPRGRDGGLGRCASTAASASKNEGKRPAFAKKPHSRVLLAAADSKKHDAPTNHRYSSNTVAMRK